MRDASKKLPWATAHRELGPRGRAADQAAWQLLVAHVPREPGAAAGEPQPGHRVAQRFAAVSLLYMTVDRWFNAHRNAQHLALYPSKMVTKS